MNVFIHAETPNAELLAIICKENDGRWEIQYQAIGGKSEVTVPGYLSCAIAVENALIVLSNDGWDGLF